MRRDRSIVIAVVGVFVASFAASVASPVVAATTSVTTSGVQAFSVPAAATGVARTVYASSDTSIDQSAPTSAAGATATTLLVRSAAGSNARTLLSFDLSAVSSNFVVTSAVLAMPVRSAANRTLEVRRVTSAWSAATTWNTAPTTASLTASATAASGTYSWSVTSDVTTMIANSSNNLGWEVRDASESAGSATTTSFSAVEAASSDAPVLRVAGYLPTADALTTAPRAIYSLRKWRIAYSGAAVRVRRSSDNTETDIAFTADGMLDSAALLAFVGSGSGYVKTWYDQSGNGYHLTQTTTTAQPRIVNAGVYDGAVRFTASGNQALVASATYGLASNSSWYVATGLRITGTPISGSSGDGAGWYFWDRTTSTNNLWSFKVQSSSGNKFCLQTRSDSGGTLQCTTSTTAVTNGTSYLVATERNYGTNFRLHVNGAVEATTTVGASDAITPPAMRLGSHVTSGVVIDVAFTDVIVVGAAPSTADRQRIEGSVAWFAGTQASLAAGHPYLAVRPS